MATGAGKVRGHDIMMSVGVTSSDCCVAARRHTGRQPPWIPMPEPALLAQTSMGRSGRYVAR